MVGVIIRWMENGGEKMIYLVVVWLREKRCWFWWSQEHQKSIFLIEEKTREILVSFASVFTIIFLSSQCSTLQLLPLSFDLFSSVLLIVFCWIFLFSIFLTLHFYHHKIIFTACIFMFCVIPFQLAKVHDFFPQHGSIYWTIPFNFYLTKYKKFNYKEK